MIDQPITPEEFARRMQECADEQDIEYSHDKGDQLMCEVLRSLGYEAGVQIFEDMAKWYA